MRSRPSSARICDPCKKVWVHNLRPQPSALLERIKLLLPALLQRQLIRDVIQRCQENKMLFQVKTHRFSRKRKRQTEEESGRRLINSESISIRISQIQNVAHMVWKAFGVNGARSVLNLKTYKNFKPVTIAIML